jgi:mannosyltransferase
VTGSCAPREHPPARWSRYAWAAPALLTLAVTGYRVDGAQVWRDELATWSAARRPVGDLLRLTGHIDAVAGPYYLFMHGWVAVLGDSPTALRAPAVLAMTATAALTTVLGRHLFGTPAGLVAGLLFAVVPSTSRYGQEARPYAPATLLAVLATLLLVRAVDRPGAGRWTAYAAATAGLGLAHLVAVSVVAGHLAAVWPGPRRRAAGFAWAVAGAGALLAPLVLVGHGQQHTQLGWVDRPGPGDLSALPGAVLQSGVVGGLVAGLAVVGAATRGRWAGVLGLCVVLPAGLLLAGGLLSPLWVPRYLVFTVPFGCLLAAGTLTAARLRVALPVVAAVAVLGAPEQAALRRTHEWPRTAPVDYAAASRIVATGQRPGDGIVYSPRDGAKLLDVAIAYHLRAHRPRDVLLARDQRSRGDLWASECDRPARCLAGVDRVWLLVEGHPAELTARMPAAKAAALRDGYHVERVWRPPGLTVALLLR